MRYVVLFIFAAAFGVVHANAQSIQERIERDELAIVDDNDTLMVEAIAKARASLPEFFKLARAPKPSMSAFSIKVQVNTDKGHEYFWIKEFKNQDGQFSGRIDNIPRWATHLKEGDTIIFAESEIVDWLYIQDRRMKGNFTFCAIMKREPNKREAKALIKRFGADCQL